MLFILPFENEHRKISSGSIYVVRVENEYYVKRMERDLKTAEITLRSDNEKYKPMTFTSDELEFVEIVGRVIFHMERV